MGADSTIDADPSGATAGGAVTPAPDIPASDGLVPDFPGELAFVEVPVTAAPVVADPREEARRADVRARAGRLVAALDRALGQALDAILHHPEFQRLEALWRGTQWLVTGIEDPMVKVRVLDVRWSEMARDLERSLDFDQSRLYELVYSQEFGMPGGEPYGIMLIDHAVSHRLGADRKIDDIAVMEGLADIAAASFCPFVVGADPSLLALEGFADLDLRQDLTPTLQDPAFARWNRMRARPDSRFLAAVMPRLLGRPLHRGRDHPRLGFVWDERAEDLSDLVWLNGGFALAHVASRAMSRYRWPAAIRGTVPRGEGGLVEGPTRQFLPSDRAGFVARFALENAVSEEQEVALNDAGIIALRQLHLTGACAFLNLPSLHRPPRYDNEAGMMNAKMGAMLNYILCVARFAHYLKVMARDWVGKYQGPEECQTLLQNWLNRYVTGDDDASPETRLRYPLREGRVSVSELPGQPGHYGCEVAIRPHYQLDQIASEFRLTTVIAGGQGS